MRANQLVYALKTGQKIAKMGYDVGRFQANLSNAKMEFSRSVRKSRYAIEKFVDDAVITIKRKPLQSVALAFGVAFGIGALAGWMSGRKAA